jgi:hypothetical protein
MKPLRRRIMKKPITTKDPIKASVVDQERPLITLANGQWHLVALKAYELYEQRGRIDGHALEDWLKAEAIINGATE